MNKSFPKLDLTTIPTPSYILVEELLENNLKILDMVQKAANVQIICALKGYAMYRTFPLVKKYLAGTTASSLHEAILGYEEFGNEVHAYSPAYNPHEFSEILNRCGHITFNSLSEWERYKETVQNNNKKTSCGLRINPEYSEVETDLYNPCIPGSRLGVTAALLGEQLPNGIEGLHLHTLCESSADALERTLQVVEEKFGHLLHQAMWLNLGGGHAITAEGYDIELLINVLQNLQENYKVKIILEPGSAVGWETGYLIASVLDIVKNGETQTAMIDTSFAAHMPDCLEMPYKPIILQSSEQGKHVYNMGGSTCLAGDQMLNYSFEQPLQVGDKLIFNDMIHYTMVKNNTFNGVNLPSIGIIRKNGDLEIVKEFGYADYKTRLS